MSTTSTKHFRNRIFFTRCFRLHGQLNARNSKKTQNSSNILRFEIFIETSKIAFFKNHSGHILKIVFKLKPKSKAVSWIVLVYSVLSVFLIDAKLYSQYAILVAHFRCFDLKLKCSRNMVTVMKIMSNNCHKFQYNRIIPYEESPI